MIIVRRYVPRVGVAEEPRHVDQDRVEQLRELVGVDLEVVEVLGVRRQPEHLHAAADASAERGALVAGEVEAAAPMQVLEHRLEAGRVGLVVGVALLVIARLGRPLERHVRGEAVDLHRVLSGGV